MSSNKITISKSKFQEILAEIKECQRRLEMLSR